MKVKGVYEAHELNKEHGYLGEARNNLESGYIPREKIGRSSKGTSALSNDASAGDVPKNTNQKY